MKLLMLWLKKHLNEIQYLWKGLNNVSKHINNIFTETCIQHGQEWEQHTSQFTMELMTYLYREAIEILRYEKHKKKNIVPHWCPTG